jgi:hypothetical protein
VNASGARGAYWITLRLKDAEAIRVDVEEDSLWVSSVFGSAKYRSAKNPCLFDTLDHCHNLSLRILSVV